MTEKQDPPKHPRGCPVTRRTPELNPDAPESIARAIMAGPPKEDWDYLKRELGAVS